MNRDDAEVTRWADSIARQQELYHSKRRSSSDRDCYNFYKIVLAMIADPKARLTYNDGRRVLYHASACEKCLRASAASTPAMEALSRLEGFEVSCRGFRALIESEQPIEKQPPKVYDEVMRHGETCVECRLWVWSRMKKDKNQELSK